MRITEQNKKINQLIDEASNIFVVSHKDLDLDAIGSCLAIYNYAHNKDKKIYLIIDDRKIEKAVDKVIKELANTINFIHSSRVSSLKDQDSLLIIMDTNKDYLLQNSKLINLFAKKIVIDHHGQSEGSIQEGLIIIDTEASSTCEMMTDFLKTNNFIIDSYLATVLLAGIVLDTNNYVLKTDSNTFYYSYYLTTCGANPNKVQYLLKQDLNKYIKRQKMITGVKVINKIAVTKGLQGEIYRREELAKAADTLLLFNNIEASFVAAKIDQKTIGISARSLDSINVGKILESFGGGGDCNEAACKIENTTANKVEKDLINVIKLL